MNALSQLIAMSVEERKSAVYDLISEHAIKLLDAEEVGRVMATSSADGGWEIYVKNTQITSLTEEEGRVEVNFSVAGDHLEGKWPAGTSLTGDATAFIDEDGKVSFDDISVKMDHPDDTDD